MLTSGFTRLATLASAGLALFTSWSCGRSENHAPAASTAGAAGAITSGNDGASGGRGSTSSGNGGQAAAGGNDGSIGEGGAGQAGVSATGNASGKAGVGGAGGAGGAGEAGDASGGDSGAGTGASCGDGRTQPEFEECDDGEDGNGQCAQGDPWCWGCSNDCTRVTGSCGNGVIDDNAPLSIKIEQVVWGWTHYQNGSPEHFFDGCDHGQEVSISINGVAVNVTPPASVCECPSSIESVTITPDTDPNLFAALRPHGNRVVIGGESYEDFPPEFYDQWTKLAWARVTFSFEHSPDVTLLIDPMGNATDDTCPADAKAAPHPVVPSPSVDLPLEQCDQNSACVDCAMVRADRGPTFDGWTQCAGYVDVADQDDLPSTAWATACAGPGHAQVRLVCGPSTSQYRYVDLNRNVFATGMLGDPETDLIVGAFDQNGDPFTPAAECSAASYDNGPGVSADYGAVSFGSVTECTDDDPGLFIFPDHSYSCKWEVENCFAQQLGDRRHLWIYVR
jgi:hypothetical protein